MRVHTLDSLQESKKLLRSWLKFFKLWEKINFSLSRPVFWIHHFKFDKFENFNLKFPFHVANNLRERALKKIQLLM